MIRRLVLAALFVVLLPLAPSAQARPGLDRIGLFVDLVATECDAPLGAGESVDVYILAVLPELGQDGIVAAEFRVVGLPESGPAGIWVVEWETDLVIGDIEDGIAIAFPEPLYGDVILLGTIHFHSFSDDWLGVDHLCAVDRTFWYEKLVVVNPLYEEIDVLGSSFTFNCGDPEGCECLLYYPVCALEPDFLDFGTVVDEGTATRGFTIRNDGWAPLSGSVSLSCPGYYIIEGGGYFLLEPGQSRLVQIFFDPPNEAGTYECAVATGAEECPYVLCTGEAVLTPAECEVNVATLDFGVLEVGEHFDRSFDIRNTGGEYLYGDVSADCEDFRIMFGGGPFGLAAGQVRFVRVRFEPTEGGEHSCVVDTGTELCSDVLCTGSAVEQVPACALSPEQLEFGSVVVGEHEDRAFTIANVGAGPISGVVAADCEHFSVIAGGGPFTLGEGGTRSVQVRFAPGEIGAHECVILTGSEICADLPCSGVGEEAHPLCEIEPASLDFGEIVVGEHVDRNFWISNVGTGRLTGDPSEDCEQFQIVLGGGPFDLGNGESRQVRVRFAPDDFTPYECSIDPGSELCDPVPVRGTGLPAGLEGCQIGLFADGAGDGCFVDLEIGVAKQVHVLAIVPSFAERGITSVEFRIANLPETGPGGVASVTWDSDLVTGDPATGIVIAWPEAQAQQIVHVGTWEFLALTEEWVGDDHALTVEPAIGSGKRVVVDHRYGEWDVGGGSFMLNCSYPAGCDCDAFGDPVCRLIPELLDFGFLEPGESRTLDFILRNDGYGWVDGSVAISGRGYELLAGGGDYSLAHGQEHHGTVRYTAVSGGSVRGSVLTGSPDCDDLPCVGRSLTEAFYTPASLFVGWGAPRCDAIVRGGEPLFVELVVSLPQVSAIGVSSVELRIDNLPRDGPLGAVVEHWLADRVQGDVRRGVTFTFDEAQTGTFVHLGSLEFSAKRDAWVESEREIRLLPTAMAQSIVVTDGAGRRHDVAGGAFTLNCGGLRDCSCPRPAAQGEIGAQIMVEERATALLPPHPNPFNPRVTLRFSMASDGPARLAVFDVAGRQVALAVEGNFGRGSHELSWEGRDDSGGELASGVYFLRMDAQGYAHSLKLVLIR